MSRFISTYSDKSFFAFLLAAAPALLLYLWQGDVGFGLSDEGFLWYGVQRVLEGEVPIRDFMSYDPGRYYFFASLMSLTGEDGILSLRLIGLAIQILGMFFAVALIGSTTEKKHLVFLFVCACILAFWMFPRHKLVDITISIFAVGALSRLMRRPTIAAYFLHGCFVGLIAVFGRNHGVYSLFASTLAILWLTIDENFKSVYSFSKSYLVFGIGVMFGFSPILIMALIYSGFASSFWEGVVYLLKLDSTNLTLSIPWPWLVDPDTELRLFFKKFLVGLLFVGLLFGVFASVFKLVKVKFDGKKIDPVVAAALFMLIPYAHYSFSRADVGHLAQGIFPALILLLSLAICSKSSIIRWCSCLSIFAISAVVMHNEHPGWQCITNDRCDKVYIGDDALFVHKSLAKRLTLVGDLVHTYAPKKHDSYLVAPFWPGAYAMFQRRAPVWELSALLPQSKEFEEKEIERLKASNVGFSLIIEKPVDGREDLLYSNFRPHLYKYLEENLHPLLLETPPSYEIRTSK